VSTDDDIEEGIQSTIVRKYKSRQKGYQGQWEVNPGGPNAAEALKSAQNRIEDCFRAKEKIMKNNRPGPLRHLSNTGSRPFLFVH
jgi:hypothetical protein